MVYELQKHHSELIDPIIEYILPIFKMDKLKDSARDNLKALFLIEII